MYNNSNNDLIHIYRGVQFRCMDCDVVKIVYPEVEEVLHMDRDDLKGDKKSLRERKAINYHE
jgi:hypothetical protein